MDRIVFIPFALSFLLLCACSSSSAPPGDSGSESPAPANAANTQCELRDEACRAPEGQRHTCCAPLTGQRVDLARACTEAASVALGCRSALECGVSFGFGCYVASSDKGLDEQRVYSTPVQLQEGGAGEFVPCPAEMEARVASMRAACAVP
jgi:hypothetical protein